jgi:hypothetical protein
MERIGAMKRIDIPALGQDERAGRRSHTDTRHNGQKLIDCACRGTTKPTDRTNVEIVKTLNVQLPECVWAKLRTEAARADVPLTVSAAAILLRHSFSLPD